MRRTPLLILALTASLAAACNADRVTDPERAPSAHPTLSGGWIGGGGREAEDSVTSSGTDQSADTTTASTAATGGWVGGGGD